MPGTDNIADGTQFELVWNHYAFDRQFRLLMMDAVERVEISVRTRMVNMLAMKTGAFGYLDPKYLPGLSADEHAKLIAELRKECSRSKELFVSHYLRKYTSESDLPIWIICELMTFGTMFTMYRGMEKHYQSTMADDYNIPSFVLESWLKTLNYIRNLCAHHSRLWNRNLAIRPFIPRFHIQPEWHRPVNIASSQNQIFSVLSLLRYMLKIIAPQSNWQKRLEYLISDYPCISVARMGFPANWKDSPIWQ